ncbi:hypothetical protein JHK85_012186 [Glycine max]|nr:hypothetical protein JHK85_012186 [Glycine max]
MDSISEIMSLIASALRHDGSKDKPSEVSMDMVVGGTDTSSNTIEFAMAEMMHNPETMKRVQEELEVVVGKDNMVEESHIHKLSYLQAVMKETLRDPSIWKKPLEFDPIRFLDANLDFSGNDFNYFPFGSGRRICAGISMAERTVLHFLATLVHLFDWTIPQGEKLEVNEHHHAPSTPGKLKPEKSPYNHRLRIRSSLSKLTLWSSFFLAFILFLFILSPPSPSASPRRSLGDSWGGPHWEKRVAKSARRSSPSSLSVLVTGAAGFVGSHVSLSLKRRGDGVLGLDNFNRYYDPALKRARQRLLDRAGVFVVDADLNDAALLRKLFDVVPFTHVMHLAAQAGVRYAMQNPQSYIHSNIAAFINLLEASKCANPQPSIVWASSSSVYGLNSKVPFSEKDRTDQPASLYAATKKAGEEIAHSYNHIYGLSITGLRFFTVYGPWGRPDMAYFFFTKDILKGKQIAIFESPDGGTVARDFTYIDDIVKGCLGALDTAKKSTGSGGKKKGPAQFRVFNLGNTSPVPVTELVAILEKLLKVKAKKKVLPMPTNGDVKFTHANISLAHRDLGYRPTTDLETGLRKFVKWYLEFYSKKTSW